MVGLELRFELGRYHATPWGSHVNDAQTEWPPSPWRLIRALYSSSRTNVGLASEREALDRALQTLVDAPPPKYELPAAFAAHTRHYMPQSSYSVMRTTDTAKVLDAFMAVDPRTKLTAWWDVAIDADAADALAHAADALGYLGRSESVCTARVVAGAGPPQERIAAAPAESMDTRDGAWQFVELLCPQRGRALEDLVVSVTQLRAERRTLPPGTAHLTYAVARTDEPALRAPARPPERGPTLAVFRVRGSARPAITEAVAMGEALRAALQSLHGRRRDSKPTSPTFSGRRGDEPRDDQHRHAHYLSLPDGEGRRVERLVVWAPEGFGPAELEALATLKRLSVHQLQDALPVTLTALGGEADLHMTAFLGPARSWRSTTPFGLVRHPKRRHGEVVDSPADQVRLELARRALPEPEDVLLNTGSWHRFRGSKTRQSRLDRARLFGVELRFSQPITGPIALGALSHFGLGVFQAHDGRRGRPNQR